MQPHRVDRDQGIIYGVKIAGFESPNRHGLDGIEGTTYTLEAYQKALPLYENAKVNIDHPSRDTPTKDRSSYDRIGKLINTRVVEGSGLFADFKLLKTHPMAERLMEAAETMPDAFGFSHNALGRGEVRGGRYVITEIPEVRSVDLVADAGATKSLFESEETIAAKQTVKQALESLLKSDQPQLKRLLEMDVIPPDMGMDAPTPATPDAGFDEHIGNAVVAVLKDETLDTAAKRKKILAMLKLIDDEAAAPTTEQDEKPGEKKEPDDKKETKESRQLRQENKALRLCLESGVKPPKPLLKALTLLESDEEMKELVETFRTPGTTVEQPKSKGPGGYNVPANTDEFVNRLVSRN